MPRMRRSPAGCCASSPGRWQGSVSFLCALLAGMGLSSRALCCLWGARRRESFLLRLIEFPAVPNAGFEACRSYLLTIDTTKEPSAIPDIDELVALPLGLWAQEEGYLRIQPSLIGL